MVLIPLLGSSGSEEWISNRNEASTSTMAPSTSVAFSASLSSTRRHKPYNNKISHFRHEDNEDSSNNDKESIQSIRGYVSSWKSAPHKMMRHRNRHRLRHRHRPRFEPLCHTLSQTVHLNTDLDEFDPPFYVQKKCKSLPTSSVHHGFARTSQKCAFDLLECVQVYSTIHLSRRKTGTHCWQPYSLRIASQCECMWPTHKFGPQNTKDEL